MGTEAPDKCLQLSAFTHEAIVDVGLLVAVTLHLVVEIGESSVQPVEFGLFFVQVLVTRGLSRLSTEVTREHLDALCSSIENLETEQSAYSEGSLSNDISALNDFILASSDKVGSLVCVHDEEVLQIQGEQFFDNATNAMFMRDP